MKVFLLLGLPWDMLSNLDWVFDPKRFRACAAMRLCTSSHSCKRQKSPAHLYFCRILLKGLMSIVWRYCRLLLRSILDQFLLKTSKFLLGTVRNFWLRFISRVSIALTFKKWPFFAYLLKVTYNLLFTIIIPKFYWFVVGYYPCI